MKQKRDFVCKYMRDETKTMGIDVGGVCQNARTLLPLLCRFFFVCFFLGPFSTKKLNAVWYQNDWAFRFSRHAESDDEIHDKGHGSNCASIVCPTTATRSLARATTTIFEKKAKRGHENGG